MNILLIEDNKSVIETLEPDLAAEGTVVVARSRASALAALNEGFFDVIILDLKIPTEDDRLDEEVEHGLFVFERLRSEHSGTPVMVFTAFGTQEFYRDILLPRQQNRDVWGSGTQIPMIAGFDKKDLPLVVAEIQRRHQEIDTTDRIEVNRDRPVSPEVRRILCVFGRRHQAAIVSVRTITGGLSGATVLRIELKDAQGTTRLTAIGKINTHAEVRKELLAYSSEVIRLPNGSYSVHIDTVEAGAGKFGGVFYRLLEGFDRNVFDLIRNDVDAAVLVCDKLERDERSWYSGTPTAASTIADVRRCLISDAKFQLVAPQLEGVDWRRLEQMPVTVRWCTQHGDLHPANVMIGPDSEPTIIDFGRVGRAAACLDPITLELSILFHPEAQDLRADWPRAADVAVWPNQEAYVERCPYAAFIRAVRGWGGRVAAARREYLATVYAYLVRQLQFADTDKELALSIARVVAAAVDTET